MQRESDMRGTCEPLGAYETVFKVLALVGEERPEKLSTMPLI